MSHVILRLRSSCRERHTGGIILGVKYYFVQRNRINDHSFITKIFQHVTLSAQSNQLNSSY